MSQSTSLNVYGEPLQPCCYEPMTGWYRDGYCHTDPSDHSVHTVCVVVTEGFLTFSRSVGNDLSTPNPHFPGLKPGDKWCLCADRWVQAYQSGYAPLVFLDACHENTLNHVTLEDLEKYNLYRNDRSE